MGMISEGYNILRKTIIQIRDGKKNPELQFFDFETILSATNNFGDDCKLGQGGFGPVYKVCICMFDYIYNKLIVF